MLNKNCLGYAVGATGALWVHFSAPCTFKILNIIFDHSYDREHCSYYRSGHEKMLTRLNIRKGEKNSKYHR